MEIHGNPLRMVDIPGLANVYITMERSTIVHGKIHYFDWAIFNSNVKLPEGYDILKLLIDFYPQFIPVLGTSARFVDPMR